MNGERLPGREKDRQERILDAVLRLLADRGIAGVSMRSVAAEAGVALGLVNYYFADKTGLVRAALIRIGQQDIELVRSDQSLAPEDQLWRALKRVVSPEFLTADYLSLRLQLWSLAQAHPDFAQINTVAQKRYRARLSELIRAARPELTSRECTRRAADIVVVQNGVWLTARLGLDRAALNRSVARCRDIALEG